MDNPRVAVENFYRVFLQRYCTDTSDPIPPFSLTPFDEAINNSFKTMRVADVSAYSPPRPILCKIYTLFS